MNNSLINKAIVNLIDWGLTALSTQVSYIVPLKSMLQLKK